MCSTMWGVGDVRGFGASVIVYDRYFKKCLYVIWVMVFVDAMFRVDMSPLHQVCNLICMGHLDPACVCGSGGLW